MSKIKMAIDINCDLGEGMPNDSLLMPFLGSCNIACGGHYGDASSIKRSLRLAMKHHVKIGAHPSYPDVMNFGRVKMDLKDTELINSLTSQLEVFKNACNSLGLHINHIKPHGALYNELARDENLAILFLKLIQANFPDQLLYCPPKSIISLLAPKFGVKVAFEIFADRSYEDDLSLVSRNHPLALLTNVDDVYEHVKSMILYQSIKTISGKKVKIDADTLCIHGDNPNALEILKMINSQFSA